MKTVVVTGAKGFVGRNLCVALKRRTDVTLVEADLDTEPAVLQNGLTNADLVYHLAGVNRPQQDEEFKTGNVGFTEQVLDTLKSGAPTPFVMTSSIQAELNNPYGLSKKDAEEHVFEYARKTRSPAYVYRLPNVFGKWSRPYYNSVVATFCAQVAEGKELSVHDPAAAVTFVYIDDVVLSLLGILDNEPPQKTGEYCCVDSTFDTTVGALADLVQSFATIRETGMLPDLGDQFTRNLYTTYLSFLGSTQLAYSADKKADQRGYLFELLKSPRSGQVFVSRTRPGITRGNHYHDSKVEKFCVVDGSAVISLRHLVTNEVVQISVRGEECRVVDVPPGWAHNIQNTGDGDLITIFWANEIFSQANPDTYFVEV